VRQLPKRVLPRRERRPASLPEDFHLGLQPFDVASDNEPDPKLVRVQCRPVWREGCALQCVRALNLLSGYVEVRPSRARSLRRFFFFFERRTFVRPLRQEYPQTCCYTLSPPAIDGKRLMWRGHEMGLVSSYRPRSIPVSRFGARAALSVPGVPGTNGPWGRDTNQQTKK